MFTAAERLELKSGKLQGVHDKIQAIEAKVVKTHPYYDEDTDHDSDCKYKDFKV